MKAQIKKSKADGRDKTMLQVVVQDEGTELNELQIDYYLDSRKSTIVQTVD